jgi:hypothetical protein
MSTYRNTLQEQDPNAAFHTHFQQVVDAKRALEEARETVGYDESLTGGKLPRLRKRRSEADALWMSTRTATPTTRSLRSLRPSPGPCVPTASSTSQKSREVPQTMSPPTRWVGGEVFGKEYTSCDISVEFY